ncbi:glycoside hydrolase family 16 protein [Tsuneonella sp. SYSU-LHT278]|uniref:glycoside hydrolase family 16 protein n=1 Tax=Tsuneonella sediminis TaxID=3416089 RepID=UPI003F78B59A
MKFQTAMPSLLTLTLAACAAAAPPSSIPGAERRLLFSDEFDGTALDRSKWRVIGMDFWVNDEQQAYVDRPDVIAVRDGSLVLTPRHAPGIDTHPKRKADFIAGRIESKGKFDFTYGRAEARIRMPDAVGVWPAFWLLGNGPWPTTGEIDVMEYVGEKDWTGVAIHGPGYSGETPFVDRFYFPPGEDATGWHVYAAEWTPDTIEFYLDGRLTYRVTRKMVEHYGKWVFGNPEHVIVNFALGGAYPIKNNGVKAPHPGLPAQTAERIKRGELAMEVDWVRVYAPE